MAKALQQRARGFSLLEMMASIAVLLVIAGGVFTALSYYQGNYQRTQLTSDLHDTTRSALDLMAQEIGQAGLLSTSSSALTTLSAAVTGGVTAQSVTVASAPNMFVGEKLLVDVGGSQEVVTAVTGTTSTSLKAIFANSHASAAVVNAAGVFPQGVLSTSTANQLQLVGDINGDGTLVYVEYNCNNQSPGPGTLTRSITSITAAMKNASSVLVDAVMPNPGGTACFQYQSSTVSGYTFIPQVGVTLTVQSTSRDPVTGQFLTITKQALDLVPRNVQMGLTLDNASITNRLQPIPPGVPILN